jgi:PIN domain
MDHEQASFYSPQPKQFSSFAPSAILVVDTNFLISDLTLVQSVQAWHSKFKHIILIPWTVIEERTSSSIQWINKSRWSEEQ